MSLFNRLYRAGRARIRNADPPEGKPGEEPVAASAPMPPPAVPEHVRRAYAMLELPAGANRQAVRAAYHRLQKMYHPDRFRNDPEKLAVAHTVSRELNVARDVVIDYLETQQPSS